MNRTLTQSYATTLILILLASDGFAQQETQNFDVTVDRNVVYGNADEPMHRADVYRLKSVSKSEKSPGVIMIHGGAWFAGDKTNDAVHAKRLAKLGIVVVAINYRLIPKHPYPAQLDDCNLALEWMTSHADKLGIKVDAMGAWGYSAGGHLSALLATHPKDGLPRLKAAVVGAAPCDLTQIPEDSNLLVGLIGGTRAKYPARYADASPVTHVSQDDPPVFMFHGSKDWLVPPINSRAMLEALEKKGVKCELCAVANKAHMMTFIDTEATEKSFLFLKQHLSGEPVAASPR